MVKAFAALKPAFEPNDGPRSELMGFAHSRPGAAVAPKEVDLPPFVPKARSGKILRRPLTVRELGLTRGRHLGAESG